MVLNLKKLRHQQISLFQLEKITPIEIAIVNNQHTVHICVCEN